MLVEFTVRNYKSIKNEVVLSALIKSNNKLSKNLNNFDEERKEFLAKVLVLYGANGSGKTNVLDSIGCLQSIALYSKDISTSKKIPVKPFKFDDKTSNSPTFFEIKFIQNAHLYIYGIELTETKIKKEYLKKSPKNNFYAKTKKIFERTTSITHNNNYEKSGIKKKFIEEISNNRAYLSVAGFRNDPEVEEAYKWFEDKLFIVGTEATPSFINYSKQRLYELKDNQESSEKYAEKISRYQRYADNGISGFEVGFGNLNLPKDMPDHLKKQIEIDLGTIVQSIHKIDKKNYYLPLKDESVGTIKLFDMAGAMTDVEEKNGVFIMDEFDCSLHPELIKNFIIAFQKNTQNCQFIFTCHDPILLDIEIMLKEQIWFTDKDTESQSTDLYCLADITGIRNATDIRKKYFSGVFGAYPKVMFDRMIND